MALFRDEEDDEQPQWELVTLDDLNEQEQMEITATSRKPMGIADSIVWVSTPCSCQDGDTRSCFVHGEVA